MFKMHQARFLIKIILILKFNLILKQEYLILVMILNHHLFIQFIFALTIIYIFHRQVNVKLSIVQYKIVSNVIQNRIIAKNVGK
jgi:hypothetical protein